MGKIFSILLIILLFMVNSISIFASDLPTQEKPKISVTITSPLIIEGKPICGENIEITDMCN